MAADSACSYEGSFGTATVSDNCSSTGQIAVDNDAPATFPLGETVVVWTATDAAGNSASCPQTVTIVDLLPPVVTCPGDVTVDADSNCRFSDGIGEASATDNCSSAGQISISNDAPAQFQLGSTVVTWMAVDEAGNAASCTQTVIVEDTQPPDLSCPSDRTRGTNAGCLYDGGIGQATATDNCSDSGDITVTNDAPAEFELGLTVVIWSASDAAGNSMTCTQEVTIVDDVPPEISCPSSRMRDADFGCAFGGAFGQATASDNCSTEGEISISNDAPGPLPLGLTVVMWMATDLAGNTAICT